jgi:hypothetical protein
MHVRAQGHVEIRGKWGHLPISSLYISQHQIDQVSAFGGIIEFPPKAEV